MWPSLVLKMLSIVLKIATEIPHWDPVLLFMVSCLFILHLLLYMIIFNTAPALSRFPLSLPPHAGVFCVNTSEIPHPDLIDARWT
jgi:hypothetical protein